MDEQLSSPHLFSVTGFTNGRISPFGSLPITPRHHLISLSPDESMADTHRAEKLKLVARSDLETLLFLPRDD